MSSVLVCIKDDDRYDCRLIIDGKKAGKWKVSNIELSSYFNSNIETEITSKSIVASSSNAFVCNDEEGSLVCSSKRKAATKVEESGSSGGHTTGSHWSKIFEELENLG